MAMQLSRRKFIRDAGILLGSSALIPKAFGNPAAASSKKVIVVGAGLAGLAAAHELAEYGHRIVLFEARTRAGGRVYTLRHPFSDGLYAELGGEWVNINHQYMHHFINLFGFKQKQGYGEGNFWINKEFLSEEAIENMPEVREVRRIVSDRFMGVNSFQAASRSLGKAYDDMDFLTFLRENGIQENAIQIMRIRIQELMTTALEEISALHIAYEFHLPNIRQGRENRIAGGNDQLPLAMAKKLGKNIRYGQPIRLVRYDSRGVSVSYELDGIKGTEDGDELVLAIPASCAAKIVFEPALPSEHADAIANTRYGRVMKTIVQSRNRFWTNPKLKSEYLYTDQQPGSVYHSSQNQPGSRGLLTCYSGGRNADAMANHSADDRLAMIYALCNDVWPGSAELMEGGYNQYWNDQEWTRGSYAFFAPGQMIGIRDLLRVPVDRIHFAGEHTADWQGYMNGAVESGVRASGEIEPRITAKWQRILSQGKAIAS